MFYVTDTHSFIFYLSKEADSRLPKTASKIFKESEKNEHIIHIPTIVLAEVQYLVENEKIRLDIGQMMTKIKMASNFRVSGFDSEILNIFQKKFDPRNSRQDNRFHREIS